MCPPTPADATAIEETQQASDAEQEMRRRMSLGESKEITLSTRGSDEVQQDPRAGFGGKMRRDQRRRGQKYMNKR